MRGINIKLEIIDVENKLTQKHYTQFLISFLVLGWVLIMVSVLNKTFEPNLGYALLITSGIFGIQRNYMLLTGR